LKIGFAICVPVVTGGSDALFAVEVERIRSNLVALSRGQLSAISTAFRRLSSNEFPKQLDRIGPQGAGNRDKFNDVDAALAALVFGYERLGPAQFLGKSLLANARAFPHRDKSRNEPGVFGRFERLLHAPPEEGFGGTQSDPKIGLSQNWIISVL
jgi:hypothetical protein